MGVRERATTRSACETGVWPMTRIGAVDAGAPQLLAFVDADDAQPVGAGFEGGPRHGDGAVTVGVRLDDGHQQRAAGLSL